MQSFLVNGFSIFLSYSVFGTALLSIMIGISNNDNNAVLVSLWLTLIVFIRITYSTVHSLRWLKVSSNGRCIYKIYRPEMFCKKTALNNFAKLKTHFENLRRSLLFVVLKLQVIGQQLHSKETPDFFNENLIWTTVTPVSKIFKI